MVSYAVEQFSDFIEEVKPLLTLHWRELNKNPDIELNPDFSKYLRVEKFGGVVFYTVREEGKLVGYSCYFIAMHPHYIQAKWATSDLFWLHPDHRSQGIGSGFFAFMEEDLRSKGVNVMHTTTKKDNPAAGLLLEKRGHAMIELGFSKRLDLTGGDQHSDSGPS